jgi:HEAT repeat protein
MRATAAKCLARLSGGSPAVLDDLSHLLDDPFADVRAHAALAISKITSDRHTVIKPLARALADESPFVRTAAAMALETIGHDAKAALPILHEALKDGESGLRNLQHGQLTSEEMIVQIPELYHTSVANAVRAAIAAIESSKP